MATILVTGASTGIGRAVALDLDRKGHTVFAGVRNDADASALASTAGDRLQTVHLDVTEQGQIDDAMARVEADAGRLDALVNNAGIAVAGPVEYLDLDDWRWQFEVNLFGQIAVTKAALPMLHRSKGRITYIGSMAGRVSSMFLGPYAGSKHAVEALNGALRNELKPFGIKVSVIEPGAVRTEIWEKARSQADDIVAKIPAEGQTRYAWHISRMRKTIEKQADGGVDPQRVADAVDHALFHARPRTRYPVGPDAKAVVNLARILPPPVIDWLALRFG